ncbi:MAG: serine/threonine-protein kinase [Polyangiaceae bacterium]
MTDDARQQALEGARALEKQGQVDAAVRAYLRVGAVADAARVLAAAKRYADAGHLVMESLGVGLALVGGLDAERKALAAKAAVCFAQAGDSKRAVELFLALGDPARAAEAAERAGDSAEAARIRARIEPAAGGGAAGAGGEAARAAARAAAQKLEQGGQHEPALNEYVRIKAFSDAGRIAYKLKRFAQAAQYFESAAMPFEAAACFAEAGDKRRCLDAVVRVPRDHPKYRLSVVQAIRAASELGALEPKLEQFVAPFVADGAKDEREGEALALLAKLRGRTAAAPVAVTPKDDVFPDLPDLPLPPVAPAPAPRTSYGLRTVSGRFPAVAVGDTPRRGSNPSQPRVAGPAPSPAAASLASPGDLAAGATVADRYRIEAKIGQGGMAAVYRATDLELGEQIAIKLFIQPSDDPQLLARFKQELTLSRGLTHPNIVRLYDIGQHQGCRFLTMELLQGTDLSAVIDGKPMEIAGGLRDLVQASSALSLAHDKGIVHRDIKPANFFITQDDTLKVMDFGIAKRQAQQSSMTQAGFIAGTPAYMSPEQINNFTAVNHLTDIYALGIVAYEMFTGAVPFEDGEMMQLLMMQLTRAPRPPREVNPAIPEALERVILKLLEKAPADRIQSARELAQLLSAIAVPG